MTPTDKKLYELFADKTLKFGCEIRGKNYNPVNRMYTRIIGVTKNSNKEIEGIEIANKMYWDIAMKEHGGIYYESMENINEKYEILGHEPQLHDVFRVAAGKGFPQVRIEYDIMRVTKNLKIDADSFHKIQYDPTLPLLQQSESTKEQLISLFS